MRQQLVMIAIAVLLCSCDSQNKKVSSNETTTPAAPTSFTGTLQSGVVGIGGEHTGWILSGDGATGGIEVDVSKVRDQASTNDGKRVTITGRMSERNYTERGKVQVLVAESITPAPKTAANRPAGA